MSTLSVETWLVPSTAWLQGSHTFRPSWPTTGAYSVHLACAWTLFPSLRGLSPGRVQMTARLGSSHGVWLAISPGSPVICTQSQTGAHRSSLWTLSPCGHPAAVRANTRPSFTPAWRWDTDGMYTWEWGGAPVLSRDIRVTEQPSQSNRNFFSSSSCKERWTSQGPHRHLFYRKAVWLMMTWRDHSFFFRYPLNSLCLSLDHVSTLSSLSWKRIYFPRLSYLQLSQPSFSTLHFPE